MYRELVGTWHYSAGSAGTVTLSNGDILLQIHVIGGSNSTVVIFGGDSIPLANNQVLDVAFRHTLSKAGAFGSTNTIVFTSTSTYVVEYLTPRN